MTQFTIEHKTDKTFDAGEAFDTLESARKWHVSSYERYTENDLEINEWDDEGNCVGRHSFEVA